MILSVRILTWCPKSGQPKSRVKIRTVQIWTWHRGVYKYVERELEEHQVQTAGFLRKLLFIRDHHVVRLNNAGFIREEFETHFYDIYTN